MEPVVRVLEDGAIFKMVGELLHCEDGPAKILVDGSEEWYKNGLLHREDGPAITFKNGEGVWYQNGRLHREDGPTVNQFGLTLWYNNGKLHRLDGPAVTRSISATKNTLATQYEWFINGEHYTEQEFNEYVNIRNETIKGSHEARLNMDI